jgi:hypothetical protein
LGLNTADTGRVVAVILGNSEESTFTPSSSPRVFKDPVSISVSDESDGMVKVLSASGIIDDSTSVALEDIGVSFNED